MSYHKCILSVFAFIFLDIGSTVTLSTPTPEGNCPDIDHVKDTPIVSITNVKGTKINDTRTEENTIVKVTCFSDSFQTNGSDVIRCLNGTWTPPVPECIPKPGNTPSKDDRLWYYIGGGAGGGVLVITMVTIIIVCVCRRKSKRRNHDKTEIVMSDIDRNRWRNSKPDGISVIGSASQYETLTPAPFFKVWSLNRSRKKLVKAGTFRQLVQKVGPLFDIKGQLKLVLEEDGTEIDNDEALEACADKIFLVLKNDQVWCNTTAVKDSKPRLTFDICSFDRATRKLILANSLKDLLHQASICLDYPSDCACLEEDGTMIDDDESLLAFAGNTLMILGKGHVWSNGKVDTSVDGESQNRLGEFDIFNSSLEQTDDGKKFFKVWSKDGKEKKVVLAKDLIDLHIKASALFGLSPPVLVSVLNEDVVIKDDNELLEHSNKTLIVSAPQTENLSLMNNPLYSDSSNMYRKQSIGQTSDRNRASWENDVNGRLELIPGTDGSDRMVFGRDTRYSLDKGQRTLDQSFHHDRKNRRVDEGFSYTEYSRPQKRHIENRHSDHLLGYQDRPDKYNQHYNDIRLGENYHRRDKRSQSQDEHGNHMNVLDNMALPYEDLSPVHKRYRHPNADLGEDNFTYTSDVKQPQVNKNKKSKSGKKRDKPEVDMSDYRGSFLATGGQIQNSHSDVYY